MLILQDPKRSQVWQEDRDRCREKGNYFFKQEKYDIAITFYHLGKDCLIIFYLLWAISNWYFWTYNSYCFEIYIFLFVCIVIAICCWSSITSVRIYWRHEPHKQLLHHTYLRGNAWPIRPLSPKNFIIYCLPRLQIFLYPLSSHSAM